MRRFCLIVAVLLLVSTPVRADEPTSLNCKVERVLAYEKLLVQPVRDVQAAGHVLAIEGMRFVRIDGKLNYTLPGKIERSAFETKRIKLIGPDGKEYLQAGRFDQVDRFSTSSSDMRLYKDEGKDGHWFNRVFLVPADTNGPLTLRFEGLKDVEVALPREASSMPTRADEMSRLEIVEVTTLKPGTEFTGINVRIGDQTFRSTFVYPQGQLISIRFKAVAAQNYVDARGMISFGPDEIRIKDQDGKQYGSLGKITGGSNDYITDRASFSVYIGKPSYDIKLFFLLPEDGIESFEMLYQGKPVAQFDMKQAKPAD